MKVVLTLLALAVSCLADAPYPPSGTRPQGPKLLLPGERPPTSYGPPPSGDYGPPQQPRGDNVEAANYLLMEKLRQTPGSERAVYHVYLPDGRLQRVRYTAAPLDKFKAGNQEELPREGQDSYYVNTPGSRLELQSADQTKQGGYLPPSAEKESKIKLASVHVMDVEPIPGPIYNIDKKELTRILRKTEGAKKTEEKTQKSSLLR